MDIKQNIVNKDINDLIFAEYNPRQLSKDQFKYLKDSIHRFGLVDPIIINKNKDRKNIIIGGHQRTKVAKAMGIKEIPCLEIDLTYDKERELNVRLNKNTGDWDYDLLANNFDIEELNDWGFDDSELKIDLFEEEIDGLIDDDEIPEVTEPICKLGDVWQLGKHRLLCGDSTKKENIELLLDGNKAGMIFTDPPYGIDMDILNDSLKNDEFDNFNNEWIKALNGFNNIPFICYHSTRTFPSVLYSAISNGWKFERSLNYVRPDKFPIHTWKSWVMVSQIILLFSKGDVEYNKLKPASQDTYIYTSKDLDKKTNKHPTSKIIKNLENIIRHFQGDVLDIFLGSGSTLIACEKTNRVCYGMELDEHYCDVTINRWEKFTGQKAEKVNGKTKEI